MGWLKNRRARIKGEMLSQLRIRRTQADTFVVNGETDAIEADSLRFGHTVGRLKPFHFEITRERSEERVDLVATVRTRSLEINAEDTTRTLPSWPVPDIWTAPIAFDADFEMPSLSVVQDAHYVVVDLDLGRSSDSIFTFGPLREEPPLSIFRPRPRPSAPRQGKSVPCPITPPPEQLMSLEERLRWILTPPIHEILTDPLLGLPADPYLYQMQGIKWLMDREGGLLADEMGLGKTMQAILAARLLWREHHLARMLIVCPKTLIDTWREEIKRWWPSALANTKVIDENAEWYLRLGTENITIKIINYERLSRLAEWLKGARFEHSLIVIDEAQRIKNPASKTAQAVKALKAPRRWALTGTPLENRIEDVISIFGFVEPGLIKSEAPTAVKGAIARKMLRRRADEVLDQLPEKDERDVPVTLTAIQRKAYERAEEEGVIRLNATGDSVTVQHVFALIQKLMQLCNFEPVTSESAKVERIAEDLEDIVASGRKTLIFSQFVGEAFGIKRLAVTLPKVCSTAEPLGVLQMHGEVRDRDGVRREFDGNPAKQVLLLNYRVGGVGLNLQAANYVFLFDRWWNPAVEDQAIKRVHRIGQQFKVFVRRLFCTHTIEERILQKLQEKRRLFAHVIDEDRPTPEMMGLSEEEVFGLFKGLKARPKRRTPKAEPLRLRVTNLQPAEFEALVGQTYEKQGYLVDYRGGPSDEGVDLVLERKDELRTERIAVQCKHVSSDVGPDVVRELLGVLAREPQFNAAHLVTSANFTRGAMNSAYGHRIELIDGLKLRQLAKQFGVADLK